MPDAAAAKLIQRWSTLKNDRASFEPGWRDAAFFARPHKSETHKGVLGPRPYDGAATRGANRLAAGLVGALMNPSGDWFRLTTNDPDLDALETVADWLHGVTAEISGALRDPAAGWVAAVHEVAQDLVVFGTAVVSLDERNDRQGLSAQAWPIWDCALAVDAQGLVDTVFRRHHLSARAARARWPDAALPKIDKRIENNQGDDKTEFLYALLPRADAEAAGVEGLKGLAYALVTIAVEDQSVVKVDGREELSVMAPRWATSTSDIYGWSPVLDALPDLKTLHNVVEKWLTTAHKRVDPPLLVDDGAFESSISLHPGAINLVDGDALSRGGRPILPIDLGIDLNAANVMREALRKDVAETLLQDLWSLPQLHNMSATEVMKRMQLHAALLGPITGRLQTDLLGPSVRRAYGVLNRQRRFAPPPPELDGVKLDIAYQSPLGQETVVSEGQGALQLVQLTQQLAAASPDVAEAIDMREALFRIARGLNAPLSIFRPKEEVEAARAARAQQQQQAAMLQQLQGAAAVANTGADAAQKLAPMMGAPMEGASA